jgi:hypothetical protein
MLMPDPSVEAPSATNKEKLTAPLVEHGGE